MVLGDVKTKWKSALRNQQQQLCNSFRGNHYIEGSNPIGSPNSDGHHDYYTDDGIGSPTSDEFPYDNMSQSSYGSHKNRNFESRSHRGSIDELRNEAENEKLRLIIMNGGNGSKKNGILSKGMSPISAAANATKAAAAAAAAAAANAASIGEKPQR